MLKVKLDENLGHRIKRCSDAIWCILVQNYTVPETQKTLRRSVTLPGPVARRVETLAKREKRSSSRVILDLIQAGLDAKEREKRTFFELADRLANCSDASEQKRIKRDLARMTYGE